MAQYLELLLVGSALWNMPQGATPHNVDFLCPRCLVRRIYILTDFTGTCTWPWPFLTYYFSGSGHIKNGTLFDGLKLCQNHPWSKDLLAINPYKLKIEFLGFVFCQSIITLSMPLGYTECSSCQVIRFCKLQIPFKKDSYAFIFTRILITSIFCSQYGQFKILHFCGWNVFCWLIMIIIA